MDDPGPFTFIVVGSGSSGMMLVHELARSRSRGQPKIKILLIERGERDCDRLPLTRTPSQWGAAACFSDTCVRAGGSVHPTLQHESAPQPGLFGRNLRYPVGNGVGGTSNINAMIWTPGWYFWGCTALISTEREM